MNKILENMKVGYYGLLQRDIEKFEDIFESFEKIDIRSNEKYDFYIFDISYIHYKAVMYIANAYPAPMLIYSYEDKSLERIKYLPEMAFIKMLVSEDENIDYKPIIEKYLEYYNANKDNFPELELRKARGNLAYDAMVNSNREKKPLEIWTAWKYEK